MTSKNWIKTWFLISIIIISIVGLSNYIIDPLWTFSHSNKYNSYQKGFNERQQKTNYVYFNGLDNYDGVLLGSSRTTFINQNDFGGMKVYNYSLSSLFPSEYEGYLNFSKKIKGEDFKYIVIGADFYHSMKQKKIEHELPSYYIDNASSLFYRYKALISLDLLKKSWVNFKFYLRKKPKKYYSRDNVRHSQKVSEKTRLANYTKMLKLHTDTFIGSNYEPNENYIEILKKLKKYNPNSKFIIFTSPISADLLSSIIMNGKRIGEYQKWVKEIIEVFGEVHHFMSVNSVTKNLQNYPDDDHYYPYIAKLLANKISKKDNPDIPKDFGILLTKDNIDAYLKDQKNDYFTLH